LCPDCALTLTASRRRVDQERLAIVKDRLGNMLLSTITLETIEGF
jgi:hypothetical protein